MSQEEGKRLAEEVAELESEPYEHEGLKIYFRGEPTLSDGKIKVNWSDWVQKAMTNCVMCRAGPLELAKRFGKFTPNPKHFKFGVASLHIRINAFLWLCKSWLYQDIKAYAKRDSKTDDPLIKERMCQLKDRFMESKLKLPVYQVNAGQVSLSKQTLCTHFLHASYTHAFYAHAFYTHTFYAHAFKVHAFYAHAYYILAFFKHAF